MTDRSMNYDLDGIFSSRNQGQLISSEPAQRSVVRTPGMVPMRKTLAGYVEAPSYSGTAGWMDDTTDLPLIGTVSNKMLLIGAAGLAGAVALFFVLKRKKG